MKTLLLFIISVLIISCNATQCECEVEWIDVEKNDSLILDMLTLYENDWKKTQESKLTDSPNDVIKLEIEQFLLPYRKIYRIERSGNKISFVSRILQSKYNAKNTEYFEIKRKDKELKVDQWMELQAVLDDNCFWTMPIREESEILGGFSYVLEVNRVEKNVCTNRNYHAVNRGTLESERLNLIYNEIFKHDPITDLEIMQEEYLDKKYPPMDE